MLGKYVIKSMLSYRKALILWNNIYISLIYLCYGLLLLLNDHTMICLSTSYWPIVVLRFCQDCDDPFTADNILLCVWTFELAKHITMHVVRRQAIKWLYHVRYGRTKHAGECEELNMFNKSLIYRSVSSLLSERL